MSAIDRSNWKPIKFGDVCNEIRENEKEPLENGIDRFVGLEHIEPGNLHIKSWGNIADGTTFTKKFEPGNILFGKRRAYQKKAAIADFTGLCSGDILVLEANEDFIDKNLLPFLVSSDKFFDYAVQTSAGSLSPRTKFKDLANYKFLLPPPEQQAKLAELLWAADEVVERYGEMKKANNILLQTYHKEQFERETLSNIKEIAHISTGSTPLRSNDALYYQGGSVSWVKTLDLNNGTITHTEEKITDTAIKETHCKILPKETVLVAMYGGFNQIGRTGILDVEAATNQAIASIQLDKSVAVPKFILYQLNAKRAYWKKVAVSSRKDPNITKVDVENFPLYLPEIGKQEIIIHNVDLILQNTNDIYNGILKIEHLQRQLINQVFG